MEGTEWGLNAQQRIPTKPSLQILKNTIYSAMKELDEFCEGSSKELRTSAGNFRKSLWRDSKKGKKQEAESKKTFITELAESFIFTNQRSCGRDPKNG